MNNEKKVCPDCEIYNHEAIILREQPYNWKKHWLYTLPEVFYFTLKILILFFVIKTATMAWLEVMIEQLPAYCETINK